MVFRSTTLVLVFLLALVLGDLVYSADYTIVTPSSTIGKSNTFYANGGTTVVAVGSVLTLKMIRISDSAEICSRPGKVLQGGMMTYWAQDPVTESFKHDGGWPVGANTVEFIVTGPNETSATKLITVTGM